MTESKWTAVPAALSDLAGEHVLECVPKLDLRHPIDSDASGCLWYMDGRTFLVFEDPNDGYRSSAAALLSFAGGPYQLGITVYERIKLPVVCTMEGGGGEVLTMRACSTGAVVFRVGTENFDDYYPSYVADWSAEECDRALRAALIKAGAQ